MTSVDLIRSLPLANYAGPTAGHYLYDPSTRELLHKRPLFGASRLQCYAVVTSTTGAECAAGALGPVMIPGGSPGSWIELFIDYRAWIEPHNVADLVRESASDAPVGQDGAGRKLAAKVFDIAQRVAGRDPAAFDRQDHKGVEALQREIEQALLRQCGLTAIIQLRTTGETAAPAIEVEATDHTADFPAPISLRVKVETFVRNSDRPQAIVTLSGRAPRYLEGLVERAARDVVREARTAQLRLDLNGEIKRRLQLLLEPGLAACYIRIRALHLSLCEPLRAPHESHETELFLDITPRDYPTAVQVRVQTHLQLVDEGAYWRTGAIHLERWLESEGYRIAARALLGATYTQLCLEPQRWEGEVIRNLQHAARALGYELSAQVSLPRLSTKLRAPILLEIDGDFCTALSDVVTQLSIAMRVQLDSIEPVRWHLDRGAQLEKIFGNVIEEELAAYLHTLHPGHLFMYFNQPPPLTVAPSAVEAAASSSTVEAVLRQRVEHALRRFELRTQSFVAKLGSSHLRSVHDALVSAPAIEFKVEARLANQVVPVPHLGSLEVRSVAPEDWALFQRKQPSPTDVSDAAARAMATLIDQQSTSLRYGLTPEEVRDLAYRRLPDEVRALLGLHVRCVGWRRERGEDDRSREAHFKAIQEMSYAAQLAEYQALLKQIPELQSRRDLALLAGDSLEAEQLAAQLETLQQRSYAAAGMEAPRAPAPRQLGTAVIEVNEATEVRP